MRILSVLRNCPYWRGVRLRDLSVWKGVLMERCPYEGVSLWRGVRMERWPS